MHSHPRRSPQENALARADRLERLERRRTELEAEYREALIAALQVTAAGAWGLFDHRQDRHDRARAETAVAGLAEIADEIAAIRDQFGMEPFALHEEFLASRGSVRAQAVGEPKQARAWLERLAAEAKS
jgi:hypothetical protein